MPASPRQHSPAPPQTTDRPSASRRDNKPPPAPRRPSVPLVSPPPPHRPHGTTQHRSARLTQRTPAVPAHFAPASSIVRSPRPPHTLAPPGANRQPSESALPSAK